MKQPQSLSLPKIGLLVVAAILSYSMASALTNKLVICIGVCGIVGLGIFLLALFRAVRIPQGTSEEYKEYIKGIRQKVEEVLKDTAE
ncbi:hypothetical protein NEOKW01_1331 [Nematocida sp. AWRm80]|nr:hypothetical protein NEOKW01_1331 [Nematocida sp. AWRm80]